MTRKERRQSEHRPCGASLLSLSKATLSLAPTSQLHLHQQDSSQTLPPLAGARPARAPDRPLRDFLGSQSALTIRSCSRLQPEARPVHKHCIHPCQHRQLTTALPARPPPQSCTSLCADRCGVLLVCLLSLYFAPCALYMLRPASAC